MRLIALIESPRVVRAILEHFGIPSEPVELCPARAPPAQYHNADEAMAWWN